MNIAYTTEEMRDELLRLAAEYFRLRLCKPDAPTWMAYWLDDFERSETRKVLEARDSRAATAS